MQLVSRIPISVVSSESGSYISVNSRWRLNKMRLPRFINTPFGNFKHRIFEHRWTSIMRSVFGKGYYGEWHIADSFENNHDGEYWRKATDEQRLQIQKKLSELCNFKIYFVPKDDDVARRIV